MPVSRAHNLSQKSLRLFPFVTGVAVLLAFCGTIFAPGLMAANNPVPYIDLVSPVSVNPGATNVTLTVLGTGFVSTSVVDWNSTALTTTFVSSKELTATVPNSLVAAVGLGSITVVSPTPGGGASNVFYFPVVAHETSTAFPSTPNSSITVGSNPEGIIAADLNGDGKLDLAVANNGDGTVSILLGNGNGTFTTKSTPTAGSGANWVAIGDFNRDGKLDLAVANLNSTGAAGVTILLGNGDGTYTTGSSLTTGSGPFAITTADFNGDGFLDLAVSNSNDGTISVFLGNGNGTFAAGSTYTVGSQPQVIVPGDFNEDGILDLAVANEGSNSVSVLLGVGNGTFHPQVSYSTGGSGEPIGLIAADYNRDNHLDLAAVNASDVAILLNNASSLGTFTLGSNPTTGSGDLIAGVAGDYSGTGFLDLFVSDQDAGEAFLLPGNGNGTFGAAQTFTTAAGAFGVATADFTGSGALDLAVANGSANNVSIFLQILPVSLSPTSLNFGNQPVGVSTGAMTVTLTNDSGSTLNISSIGFTGADAGDFSSGGTCSTTSPVTNGNTCTITVTFTAGAEGPRVATLTVTDNAGNSPQTLAVSGAGEAAPLITSSNSTTMSVGQAGSFTVTTTGYPAPTLSETGSLPSGVTFTNNGNGTATLAGTPATGTTGTYPLTITASNGVGSNAMQSFTLQVGIVPLTFSKDFGTGSIAYGGTTSLTLSISNPSNGSTQTGIAFTDTLPAGLVVSTPNNLISTCSGTASATAGSVSASLSGTTLAASAGCTVSLNVTATALGVKNNSVQISSTQAGAGATATASLTVTKGNSATTVTSSANPSVFGQSVTFTATVSAVSPATGTPTGTVTFLDGGSPIGTGTLSGGVATFITAALAVGNHTITTSYGGDGNFNGSTGSLTGNPQVVNKANTATTVTSSVNPSVFGQSVTFTATASAIAPGSGTPTGTVTFLDGGSPIGTGTLSGGVATFITAALAVGNHTITTSYGGDGNFNGSTGSLTGNPQVVNKANTATIVTSSVNPSVFGQSVTFTATAGAIAPGSGIPMGTVTFLDGGSPIGSGTLVGGVASFTTSSLAVGNHTITTSYGGDGNFNGSVGSLTGNPQVVNKGNTATTVTSSQNPSTATQSVTFTATVSSVAPASGTPTGTVTFLDGGSPIGSCGAPGTLSGGVATCTTSALSPGSHTITTSYAGDGNFNGSTGSLTGNPQVVTESTTTTTVISSQGTITLGNTVTFTATVTASSGTASGLVTFFDGATPLGSGTLQLVSGNEQATFTTSLLSASASPHSISAIYQGSASFAASTSSPVSETVNQRPSTTAVALNPTTVVVGQASTATITLTDSGSVPPGTADTFGATGAPSTGRTNFTSTLFADGLVLVSGGSDVNNNVLQSAEIYSVSGANFTATGNLNTARTGAVAVLLPNGMVLVAGGSSNSSANGALNTAELFNPGTGTFAVAGSGSSNTMTAARFGATATLLNTGKVLLSGGANSGGVLNSAELYDPVADAFTATGNLNTARTGASATLLGTGKVLIAGGSSDGTANGALNSAEVFDPAGNSGAGTFTLVAGANPTLAAGRWQPEVALLLSGKVLVAGGQNSGGAQTSADLYDPVANSFTASNQQMSQARANGSAVATPSGMVLFAGGTTSQAVDLYDPDSDKFDVTGSLQQSDSGLISTLLNNGQVLVVGLTSGSSPASDAELYSPSFNPLGSVGLSSSEATDAFGSACVLTPSSATASACTSTVTSANVATSPHTVTGTYPADAVHLGGSNTASLIVDQANTVTTAISSVNPSVFGQSVMLTVTVSAVAPGAGTPTGTVTFLDGGTPIGSGTLSGGVATFNSSTLAVANHTITANYGGDANFNSSTGSLNANPQVVNKANSSIAVTSSQNPAALGQSVTFTATVSAVAPGTGTPTGTVVFLDGGTSIGNGTLTTGVATFTSSSLVVGNHTITASYAGDTNFNASLGSLTGNPEVVAAPPVIAKSFSPVSIAPNGVSTMTITVSNPAANTVPLAGVAFTDSFPANLFVATPNGLTNTCGGTVVATAGSGSTSLTGGTIAANGSCSVTVNVTGSVTGVRVNTTGAVSSTNGGTGNSATASVTIGLSPAITSANATSFAVGAAGSFTVTTTGAPIPSITETGALPTGVTFTDNGNGTATLAGTSTVAGAFPLTITAHNGFGSDATQVFTLTVGKGTPVLTWAAPTAITYGTALSATQLDATASVPGTFVYTPPAGTVDAAGSQTLSVTFTPTDSADYTTATTTAMITVNKATPTITWAAPAAIGYGTPLGSTQLDATANTAGTFVYSPAAGVVLNVGAQTLSVTFTPSDAVDYNNATAQVSLSVNTAATTTVVTSSSPSVNLGASVTLSATVTSATGTPTGTVTFFNGGTSLGTATLASGTATLSISTLAAGANSITANYPGNANFAASTSAILTETIVAPDFTLSLTAPKAVQAGQTLSVPITLTPVGGITGTAVFTVTGLPVRTNFTLSPTMMTIGASPSIETLTIITTPHFDYLSERTTPASRFVAAGTFFFPLAGLVIGGVGFTFRRNRKAAACLLLVLLFVGVGLGGCASMGNFQNTGTPSGTYPLTITATATTPSGTTTHSTTVTLIVK